MTMKFLKQYLKENGREYYEKVVANHNRVIEMNHKQQSMLQAASLKKEK